MIIRLAFIIIGCWLCYVGIANPPGDGIEIQATRLLIGGGMVLFGLLLSLGSRKYQDKQAPRPIQRETMPYYYSMIPDDRATIADVQAAYTDRIERDICGDPIPSKSWSEYHGQAEQHRENGREQRASDFVDRLERGC